MGTRCEGCIYGNVPQVSSICTKNSEFFPSGPVGGSKLMSPDATFFLPSAQRLPPTHIAKFTPAWDISSPCKNLATQLPVPATRRALRQRRQPPRTAAPSSGPFQCGQLCHRCGCCLKQGAPAHGRASAHDARQPSRSFRPTVAKSALKRLTGSNPPRPAVAVMCAARA